jgi:hypothetical protein
MLLLCAGSIQPCATDDVTHLRWDQVNAPLGLCYDHTRQLIEYVLVRLDNLVERTYSDQASRPRDVDDICNTIC